jgi:serine/threonine-protein kinase
VLRSRWRRLSTPVAALAAGVLLGVGALQLFDNDDAAAPVASAEAHAASGTAGGSGGSAAPVVLTAGDYLGRPYGDVEAALVGLGLRVRLAPVETGDVAAGLVTAVTPAGSLRRGDSVTVTYATAPATQQDPGTVAPVEQVAVAAAASASPVEQAGAVPPVSAQPATAAGAPTGAGAAAPAPGKAKAKDKDKPAGPGKAGPGHDG